MKPIATFTLLLFLMLQFACSDDYTSEEIVFHSGEFRIVGELRLPPSEGPHPVILFVHGDGPNNRTSGVTYPPIMTRMLRAGYATFAWDKPGTGESTGRIDRSRLVEQRARIVLDALARIKEHPAVVASKMGLWGISQAGYVMPKVLTRSDEIAFMIAVSCPGEAGVEQGAYLVAAQVRCAGVSEEEVEQLEYHLAALEWATTYEEWVKHKKEVQRIPILEEMGFNLAIRPREEWHEPNLDGPYFFDPMTLMDDVTIPVLVFFGEKDTQADPIQGVEAYREALERAGNTNYRVELIPGVDHNLLISETGSLKERDNRPRNGWQNYSPLYLDILEEWLGRLYAEE
jgi:pimeloyl-ACP methyl ester carboxylesterase